MEKTKDIIFAIIVFLTGFVLVPQAYIFPFVFVIGSVAMLAKLNKGINTPDLLLLLVLLLSSVIFIVGYPYADNADSVSVFSKYVPYTFLIAATFYFSNLLSERALKFVFSFLMFEILIGILEFAIGIPYIFAPSMSNGETEYGSTDLLYFNRVYGLSGSVSVFAQKVLAALILLHYLKFNRKWFRIFIIVIIIGFLVSFNRTAIISAILFALFYYSRNLKAKTIFTYIGFSIPLIFVGMKYWEVISNQFFRGKGDVDYSGRDIIFDYYIDFIFRNPFFGNFAQKLWYSPSSTELFHAHNSYLETISSLGGLVSLFLFAFVVLLIIRRKSLLFVFPLLIYSLFQYGFFWGVSFLDIIFFTMLLNNHSISNLPSYIDQERNNNALS